MKLVHTGLPDTKEGQGHNGGWNFFMDFFTNEFGKHARK